MTEHPLLPEQEEEMRARARQVYLFHSSAGPPAVILVLGEMVLPGGRLGSTVPMELRVRIAHEERPKPVA